MDQSQIRERMAELMEPIDKQIMMCNNREELLMMACAMLTTVRTIFDNEIGIDGRKKMFKDFV